MIHSKILSSIKHQPVWKLFTFFLLFAVISAQGVVFSLAYIIDFDLNDFSLAISILAPLIVGSFIIFILTYSIKELADKEKQLNENLSSLKETNQQFEKQKILNQALFHASSDAIMMLDDKHFFDCNKATLDLFKFDSVEEFSKIHPADVSPKFQPDGTDSYTAAMQRIKTAMLKGNHQFEWIHKKKDGSIFLAEVLLTAISLESKTVLQAVVRDITQRRESEKKLKLQSMALQQSMDGIAIFNQEGFIVYINKAWAYMHGYKTSELVGEHIRIFHSKNQMKYEINQMHTIVLKNGSYSGEINHTDRYGIPFPTWMTVSILRNENDNPVGFVCTARDITHQKQAEKTLISAKKAAEYASQLKSEFLANVSHEIRTPMNGIIGMAELMTVTKLSDEQTSYLNAIRESADSLLNVINDILDISKIDAGKMHLEIIPFDIYKTIELVNTLMSHRAKEKDLEYVCNIQPKVPKILKGDPVRLRQILINLVGNAVKFTPKGKIKISVKMVRQNSDLCVLRFEVIDTGIGITTEKMSLLFKEFSQIDSSTTRKFGGTGLGLSISKKLVELMNGRIGVKSKINEGSLFWFELKFEKDDKNLELTPQVISALLAESNLNGNGSIKILLAEDNHINQQVTSKMLEKMGIKTDVVSNGKQALEYIAEREYDLILMDCQMPEMDGYEATRRIRDRQDTKNIIPIIAMTANAMKGDKEKCIEAGMNDYLSKPVKSEQLKKVIELWIANKN